MHPDPHRAVVTTLKGLAIDAIDAANSGHPGMPLGAADMAAVLWTRFLRFVPDDPTWPDRDRFVLSAGHGSMLLYGLLHLAGFEVSLDDLRQFRQWGSITPGHPEVGHTPGVETTTGPLGQGFATGVGMAIAERRLRETFGAELCDHWIYGIVGDGDLMEGIAYEAASIAGHLQLGRLIYLWDDNRITIDGPTTLSFTEDVGARMEALGWHVQRIDGHDPEAIASAIEAARRSPAPSLIACRTQIGHGSPNRAGTPGIHGKPLGEEEGRLTKLNIGLDPDRSFVVLEGAREAFQPATADRDAWRARLEQHPRREAFLEALQRDGDRAITRTDWPRFDTGTRLATRVASREILRAAVEANPWIIGGSADLAGSNGTNIGAPSFGPDRFTDAQTLHFGVREHAMGAICNGISLHGGALPYGATFLAFHDYQRPALRLAALMGTPGVWIYTHDSIFLGEDGPTHQPIATLLAIRSLPNVELWRPADAHETVHAWQAALRNRQGPTVLVLSRQGLPVLDPAATASASRGGYTLRRERCTLRVCILATGSEVATSLEAAERLEERGIGSRVVSLPCRERFLAQPAAYRDAVLPPGVPRVSVEAGVTLGWERWTGPDGLQIGIDRFGASAPAAVLAEKYGFTGEAIAERIERFLSARTRTKVGDLMTPDPITVGPRDALGTVIQHMVAGRIREVPVVEDGRLRGILTDRDVKMALGPDARSLDVEAIDPDQLDGVVEWFMTPDVATTTPDTPAADALRELLELRVGALPVVDGDGAVVGILSRTDLLRAALPLL